MAGRRSYRDDDSFDYGWRFPHSPLPTHVASALQGYLLKEAEKAAKANGVSLNEELARYGITKALKSGEMFSVDGLWGSYSKILSTAFLTEEKRKEIQRKLNDKSKVLKDPRLNVGDVDGDWGPVTMKAIAHAVRDGKFEKIFGTETPERRANAGAPDQPPRATTPPPARKPVPVPVRVAQEPPPAANPPAVTHTHIAGSLWLPTKDLPLYFGPNVDAANIRPESIHEAITKLAQKVAAADIEYTFGKLSDVPETQDINSKKWVVPETQAIKSKEWVDRLNTRLREARAVFDRELEGAPFKGAFDAKFDEQKFLKAALAEMEAQKGNLLPDAKGEVTDKKIAEANTAVLIKGLEAVINPVLIITPQAKPLPPPPQPRVPPPEAQAPPPGPSDAELAEARKRQEAAREAELLKRQQAAAREQEAREAQERKKREAQERSAREAQERAKREAQEARERAAERAKRPPAQAEQLGPPPKRRPGQSKDDYLKELMDEWMARKGPPRAETAPPPRAAEPQPAPPPAVVIEQPKVTVVPQPPPRATTPPVVVVPDPPKAAPDPPKAAPEPPKAAPPVASEAPKTHTLISGSLALPTSDLPLYFKPMVADANNIPKDRIPAALQELASRVAEAEVKAGTDPSLADLEVNKMRWGPARLAARLRQVADAKFDEKVFRDAAQKALDAKGQRFHDEMSKELNQELLLHGLHAVANIEPPAVKPAPPPPVDLAEEKRKADAAAKAAANLKIEEERLAAVKKAETDRLAAEARKKDEERKAAEARQREAEEAKAAEARTKQQAEEAKAAALKEHEKPLPPHRQMAAEKARLHGLNSEAKVASALTEKAYEEAYKNGEVYQWGKFWQNPINPLTAAQVKGYLASQGLHVSDAIATHIAGANDAKSIAAKVSDIFKSAPNAPPLDPQATRISLEDAWNDWGKFGLPPVAATSITSAVERMKTAFAVNTASLSPAEAALAQQNTDDQLGKLQSALTRWNGQERAKGVHDGAGFSEGQRALAGLRHGEFGLKADAEVEKKFLEAYGAHPDKPLEAGLKAVFDHASLTVKPEMAVRAVTAVGPILKPPTPQRADVVRIADVSLKSSLVTDDFNVRDHARATLKDLRPSLTGLRDPDRILGPQILHNLRQQGFFFTQTAKEKSLELLKGLKVASLNEAGLTAAYEKILGSAMKTDLSVAETVQQHILVPQHKQLRVFLAGHGDGDPGATSKDEIGRIPDYFKHYLVNDPKDPAPGMHRPMSLEEWENWAKKPPKTRQPNSPQLGPRKFAEHWGASIIANISVQLSQQRGHDAMAMAEHPFGPTLAKVNEIKPDGLDLTHLDWRGTKHPFGEPQVWIAKAGAWDKGCHEDRNHKGDEESKPLGIVSDFSKAVMSGWESLGLPTFGGRTEPTKQTARHLPALNICNLDFSPASGSDKIPYPVLVEAGNVVTIADHQRVAFGKTLEDSFFFKVALAKVAAHDNMAAQGYGNPKIMAKPTIPLSTLLAQRKGLPGQVIARPAKPLDDPERRRALGRQPDEPAAPAEPPAGTQPAPKKDRRSEALPPLQRLAGVGDETPETLSRDSSRRTALPQPGERVDYSQMPGHRRVKKVNITLPQQPPQPVKTAAASSPKPTAATGTEKKDGKATENTAAAGHETIQKQAQNFVKPPEPTPYGEDLNLVG